MFSKLFIVFLFVNIFSDASALVELPQVEENNILETDTAIRQTTNNLFSLLNLKLNKDRPNLKQYSLIHNYLVSTTLQDYTNLKEIAKLTRVDKTRLNNETRNFMAVVIEILNEDIKHDTVTEDEYVIKHIEGFLTNLDLYTGRYDYSENISDEIVSYIFKILEKNRTFSEALNKTDSDKSWLESDEDSHNLINDNEFWVPSARRIFQGQKAKIKDFPFLASIHVFNQFQCAGSIIKSDLIITAASCLQLSWNNRFFRENPKFLTARVGSSFHTTGGENIEVLEIYFHPNYDPKSLKNNLCVLRLLRQLKFMRKKRMNVMKIELDRKPNPVPVVKYGRGGGEIEITTVGWGAKKVTHNVGDQYLSFTVLDIYPVQECQVVYSQEYVTQKNFCAGFMSRGGGACNKDIGGPGILNGVLVGVVSFGSAACGTPDAPTVFTKVGFYADWIDSIIEQNVARVKKRTTLLRPLDLTPPIFYTSPKTTFQVTPMLRMKKKAREMEQIEMLREIQTKGLLKEFVNKVIGSDEARDLLREAEAVDIMENLEKGTRSQHTSTTTMATKPLTIPTIPELDLNFYSNSSSETIEELSELEADVTKSVDKDKALETQIERDVMDIIDKMNEFVNDTKTNVKKIEQNYDDSDTKNFLKVLYLPEKKRNLSTTSAVSEEINEGIQIPLEIPSQPSLDLTYRNNKTDTEIFLSRQDLIDLFSEALKEEIQIKTKATPGIVVQRSETSTSTIKRNATLSLNEMKISYLEQLKKKTVYTKN